MNEEHIEETPETAVTPQTDPDIAEPDNALPEVSMTDLPDSWQAAAARAGWTELMPVQAKAMPYIMAGRDLMVQARTGSGKTGAFVMPILERINPLQANCQALILVPTRELALQVTKEAETLSGGEGPRVVPVYGGTSYKKQLKAFREGAHLVVGTPGRILDHLGRGTLKLDNAQILVFDEADRLLSMGFYPDMRDIQRYLPSKLDAFMFSATFPATVQSLARQFLTDPDFLSLSRDSITVADTEHIFYNIPAMDKDRALIRVIELENPTSAFIFCNTKARVEYVATILKRFGYDADLLTSDLNQNMRERIMARVRQSQLRFLVTTDVAARGIDIPALSHVIQYEVPEDPEVYVHRAGRTGRAGETGIAIIFTGDFNELVRLKRIRERYSIDMEERPLPTDEDVTAVINQRLTALLESKRRTRNSLELERMQRFLPLAQEMVDNEENLSIIAMLLDDIYQQSLHAPPPQPKEDTHKPKQQKKRRHSRSRSRNRRRR
ncbi:MAG: DEAD/DEAH box helicase [Chloroflexi bacterium]|nr:MAG: DEAD/DEAH box helicase [Chloroflexota bacterium]